MALENDFIDFYQPWLILVHLQLITNLMFFADGEKVESYEMTVSKPVDKVYNTTATMRLVPTEEDTMSSYKCEVTSVALNQPIVQEIGLKIIGKARR